MGGVVTFLRLKNFPLQITLIIISREEVELIFKIRCRVTEVKMNLKGNYSNYECDLCEKENKTQAHILRCTTIVNMKKYHTNLNYNKNVSGSVEEQLEIENSYHENMEIRKKLIKSEVSD